MFPSGSFRAVVGVIALLMIQALSAPNAHGAAIEFTDNTIPLNSSTPFGGKGSKLAAHASAMIQATDCGNPNSTEPNCNNLTAAQLAALISPAQEDAAQCRTITNNNSIDYFVPWSTPREFGSFLAQLPTPANPAGHIPGISIHRCCPPLVGAVCANRMYNGQLIGPGGIPVSDAQGNPIQLGMRVLGRRTDMLSSFGAQSDISQTLDAAALLGDASINYQVTYVCDADNIPPKPDGTPGDPWEHPTHGWIKTFEQGSCTPIDGACNPAIPSEGMAALPSDLQQLCTSGSIMQNLVDHGSYWSWDCTGTSGMASTACSMINSTVDMSVGHCGTADDSRMNTAPASAAELCASGMPSTVTGNGSGSSPWRWSCIGTSSSNETCIAYMVGATVDGVCGSSTGYVTSDPDWNPADGPPWALCKSGTQTSTTGVTQTSQGWEWTCLGENGGVNQTCNATLNQSGRCNWPAVDGSYGTTPPNPAVDLLCSEGTPSAITYGLEYPQWGQERMAWKWECLGPTGYCNGTGQCLCERFDLNTPQIGQCGGAVWGVYTGTTTPTDDLCDEYSTVTGPPTLIEDTPPRWNWICAGNNGGTSAACSMQWYPGQTGGICGAADTQTRSTEPSALEDLCSSGTPYSLTLNTEGTQWLWSCLDQAGFIGDNCWAAKSGNNDPNAVDGVCGTAGGAETTSAPTTNLCAYGTPTLVTGTGPWTWSCSGVSGGFNAACVANLPVPTGPGQCGSASNTSIPTEPNTNLCAVGNPSPVSGSGPWNWNCTGTTTVSCQAVQCNVCAGNSTPADHIYPISKQMIAYGNGTCRVSGVVAYTENNTLISSNAPSNITLTNAASGLDFAKVTFPDSAPVGHCPPCYRKPTAITGQFYVMKNGACSTGDTTLDSGGVVTIPISGATIQ